MKSRVRLLSVSCAIAVLAAVSGPSAKAAPGGISCVVPSLWKAEPQANFSRLEYSRSVFDMETAELSTSVAQQVRAHQRTLFSAGYPVDLDDIQEPAAAGGRWSIAYKGTGYDRLRGEARERVARGGVLWSVRPRELGVSASQAIAALVDAGATVARSKPNGIVEFRAPRESAREIAAQAAQALGGSGVGTASLKRNASYRPAAVSHGLRSEVAMLRLEGRSAQSAVSFIEQLPSSGMTVYPYGTSFVVHVPPASLEALRDYLQEQGSSIVLVGAAGPLSQGRGIGSVIRSCGATVLADRFPTPPVHSASSDAATVNIEGQYISVAEGDIALVVQQPAWGQGLEVAFIRFMR